MRFRSLFAVLLAGALQVMPMLRAVLPVATRGLAPASWAWVLKIGGGAVALLGSCDAVSGATQIVAPYTVNATVGTPYSRQLTTSGQTAHSWSANTAPLGTPVFPLTPGLWLTNSSGRIGGTPTWAGSSNITISAWEKTGNTGASVNSVFLFTITNNAPPPPVPPSITSQPRSLTNNVNTTATFAVTATGTTPLSYQWRFQGNPVSGATLSSYSIASVQPANAGSYSVVITNVAGSITSSPAVLTVVQQADLAVFAAGPAAVLGGSNLTYTVTVTNLGPASASNVVVSDVLPLGAGFVSATAGGVQNGGTVTWPAIVSLGNGASTIFNLTVSSPLGGSLTNVASCTSTTTDPALSNNNGTAPVSRVVTSVTAQSDLAVTCAGPSSVNAAGAITYTITVTNLGPSAATGVMAVDALPPGVTFVSASGGATPTGGSVTWPSISNLASGGSATFIVSVKAPAGGSLTNVVSCTSATFDPQNANNDGTSAGARAITAVQPQADLAVLANGPAAVLAGSNMTFTVTVTNSGPSGATGVVVTDVLPAGAPFVSATGGAVANAGVLTWPTISSLGSGAAVTFNVTLAAPFSGVMTNIASCTASTPDPIAANNNGSSPESVLITSIGQQADVAVWVTGPASALPGANLTYTITVTNLGPTGATNIVVSDNLPGASTFVSASGGGVASGGVVTWPTIGFMDSGGSLVFTVNVTAPSGGSLTNIATSTSTTPDPQPANNNGSAIASRVVTTVSSQADLAVTCSGPSSVNAGASLNYTIVVSNFGPSTASNVLVSDALPAGAVFLNATGGGSAIGRTVNWPPIANLGSGGTLSLTVTVSAPSSGTLTNHASCSSGTADPVPGNNDGTAAAATVLTAVQPLADVVVICRGPASVTAGTPFPYTITVSNQGPSAAASVQVVDPLPANLTFVSASGGGTLTGGQVAWPPIPSLVSGSSTNFSLTVSATSTGAFTNLAISTSSTPDPDPSSNDGSASASRVITTVTAATAQFAITGGTHTLNPQTGLFEESVRVSNTGTTTAGAVRLYVTGLRSGVQLFNATGTNVGRPFVQSNAPLNPGASIMLLLEFFVADRLAFSDSLSAEAVLPAAAPGVSGNGLSISRAFVDTRAAGSPRFVIEFPTTPGQVCTVIYSDDNGSTWKVVTPSLTASATATQWYDDGPPKTDSVPLTSASRLYRVIAGSGNP